MPTLPVSRLTDTASGRLWTMTRADLERDLALYGERTLAGHLGVARSTLQRRCVTIGVRKQPRGRKRGSRGPSSTLPGASMTVDSPTLELVRLRMDADGVMSEAIFAERIRALQDARVNGHQLGQEDAWIALAAAAGLMHQQQRQTRRAA